MLLNLDGALFLENRLICACLRCFSLLIVLLESVMQCVILLFCYVLIIADCRISKKQACSAGRLLAGGRYRVTLRESIVLRTMWLSAPVLAYVPVDV